MDLTTAKTNVNKQIYGAKAFERLQRSPKKKRTLKTLWK